jgi:polyisoprenoid-binding protein YceI
MKYLILLSLVSLNSFAATSTIKFTAKTNGPGIEVEGEVQNPNVKIDFNKMEGTNFSADVMNLSTGMEKRDKHLHEKVFSATNIGMAKIDFTISKMSCPTSANSEVECDCIGNLKIKDLSNEIKFKALVNKTNQVVSGKALVSLNQFKLTAPTFMGISVLDNVEVTFNVSAK